MNTSTLPCYRSAVDDLNTLPVMLVHQRDDHGVEVRVPGITSNDVAMAFRIAADAIEALSASGVEVGAFWVGRQQHYVLLRLTVDAGVIDTAVGELGRAAQREATVRGGRLGRRAAVLTHRVVVTWTRV